MISLPHLNKLIYSTVLICLLVFKFTAGIAAVDIWEKKEEDGKQSSNKDEEIKIKNKMLQ